MSFGGYGHGKQKKKKKSSANLAFVKRNYNKVYYLKKCIYNDTNLQGMACYVADTRNSTVTVTVLLLYSNDLLRR